LCLKATSIKGISYITFEDYEEEEEGILVFEPDTFEAKLIHI